MGMGQHICLVLVGLMCLLVIDAASHHPQALPFRSYGSDTVLLDYISILATTLFTFQDFACDKEYLVMKCPAETFIKVQWAQYGRLLSSLQKCPDYQAIMNSSVKEDTSCLVGTSLKVVEDKCQNERRCKLLVSAQTFGENNDPCPETTKYLEVAYQCRPKRFLSRLVCEGEELQLRCDNRQKLAIYSATFGRSDNEKSDRCSPSSNYDSECRSSCALHKVINECHGKRRCSLPATEGVFGNPCRPGTSKYLTVTYTCVPRRILRELKANHPARFCHKEGNEPEFPPSWPTAGRNSGDGAPAYPRTSTVRGPLSYTMATEDPFGPTFVPPATSKPEVAPVQEGSAALGVVNDWMSVGSFIKENKEKFILYVMVSLLIGIILVLLLVIIRLRVGKNRQKTSRGKLDISTGTAKPAASSMWETGLSPTESETPTHVTPAAHAHPPPNPEEMRLLSTGHDTTGDTDDSAVMFAPQSHRTLPHEHIYRNNHYSTTPKTFASPTNGNGQYHAHTLGVGQRPSNNLYSNQFRTSPIRTNSLPRHDSEDSTFDNYYR